MNERTQQILARLPAHMEAARPGKLLGAVSEALATGLEELSADLAATRRAHRLAHADTVRDLQQIGALHGLGSGDFALALGRLALANQLADDLRAAVDEHRAADRDTIAERIFTLWAIDLPPPRLVLYAPPASGPPDLDEAARRLVRTVRALTGYPARVEAVRRFIGRRSRTHQAGNGTVRALIDGTAGALDLELDFDFNRRVHEALRPTVTASAQGAAGTTRWAYVVVARSRTLSHDERSLAAVIKKGAPKLDGTNFNRISWAPQLAADGYLVYRVEAGGDPATTGLVTPDWLDPTVLTFDDHGAAAGSALVTERDDGLFHSRDRFWHSSYTRDPVPLSRRVDAVVPAKAITAPGTALRLTEIATQLALTRPALLAAIRAAAGPPLAVPVDGTLDRGLAGRVAVRVGQPLDRGEAPLRLTALAGLIGVSRTRVLDELIALDAGGVPVELTFTLDDLDPLAPALGYFVVRPTRALADVRLPVAELVRLVGRPPVDVLRALDASGTAGVDLESIIDINEARAAADALGVDLARGRILRMGASLTVAQLATALGLPLARVQRELAILGVADVTPGAPLAAEIAAPVAYAHDWLIEQELPAEHELIGLEENPERTAQFPAAEAPKGRHHAERFNVLRWGFGHPAARVEIGGIAERTHGPMIVDRDAGIGLAFAGPVPAGKTLVLTEEGRGLLDGADVTSSCWSWRGACFADEDDDVAHPRDFVFAGPGADPSRVAAFAVATPFDAFDPAFTFPQAGVTLPTLHVRAGRTRYALFVQTAHLSPVTIRPKVGFFDGSVFESAPPAPGETPVEVTAAEVTLFWTEHEVYAVRVLIPRRFSALDEAGAPATARVEDALERLRAAGIEVRVETLDERWTLGSGFLAITRAADPIASLRGDTVLWTIGDSTG